MITLHLLEYLRLQGFGTGIDNDLFFEKMPLGKIGLAIYSVGGPVASGRSTASQQFEITARGDSDLDGAERLENVISHFSHHFDMCTLPVVGREDIASNRIYTKCRIVDIGNILNVGWDANDRVIYKFTARIIYSKQG